MRAVGFGIGLTCTGCFYDNTIVKHCADEPDRGWIKEDGRQYRRNFILETEFAGIRMNMPTEMHCLEEAEKLQERLFHKSRSGNVRAEEKFK